MKIRVKNLPPGPGYPPPKKTGRDVVGMTPKHITKLKDIPKPSPVPRPRGTKEIIWTDDKIRELAEMYNSGLTLAEIAEKTGSTVRKVSSCITSARQRGYVTEYRHKQRAWTHEEDMILLQMWYHGNASDVIAEKLGRTRKSVMARLRILRRQG